jgi:low affinity Fe/Cu permease
MAGPVKKLLEIRDSEANSTQGGDLRAIFGEFAQQATVWTGSAWAFGLAVAIVVVWGFTGPFFGFSDSWQLVINTGTTIVTFLMVFVIQRSQNRDTLAIQLKLNEIVAALQGASNRLINVEGLPEREAEALQDRYQALAELAKGDECKTQSCSVEDADPSSNSNAD